MRTRTRAATAIATSTRPAVLLVLGLLAVLLGPDLAHHLSAPRPTTTAATATTGHPARPPATHPPAAAGSVVLRRGDTLWSLARRHGTTVAALQKANRLGRSTLILAGHRLRLPADGTARRPGSVDTARDTTPSSRPAGPGRAAVAFARDRLGTPYVWGGTGRGGYDCSGLVQAAWRSAGVTLPRTTYEQVHAGTRVRRAALRPGDLVFTHGLGHVQMYAGDGRVVEATRPVVRHAPLPAARSVTAYVRPTRR
ncbi:C40 family peptidase [Streptomyces sp. NPDC047821]|uniref:C40 family peptidase n=1 Tax=Streptomyces sp. NPDC047821 TaxID=3365488 RepID=UPI0037237179